MADFKPIETQEQLDQIIKDRLERKESSVRDSYKDYLSPESHQTKLDELKSSYEKQIQEMSEKYKDVDAKYADYEAKLKANELESVKIQVALANGIPYELANKLSGTTKEEIEKDAQTFAKFMQPQSKGAPGVNPERKDLDGVSQAFLKLNPNLKI